MQWAPPHGGALLCLGRGFAAPYSHSIVPGGFEVTS